MADYDVVVVGAGNAAMEAAVSLGGVGDTVTWSPGAVTGLPACGEMVGGQFLTSVAVPARIAGAN
jgi:thioredoxin reductase